MSVYSKGGGFGGYLGSTGTHGPIDVVGLRREHKKFDSANDRVLWATLQEVGDDAVAEAKAQRKIKNRTGALARGWHRMLRRQPRALAVSLVSNVKHAFFQELGTGLWGPSGQRIRPIRAKFLRWIGPGGKVIFARSVKGVPPKFIGKHAAFEAWSFGKAKFNRALGRLASRF